MHTTPRFLQALPNLITFAALACGLASLVFAHRGFHVLACGLIATCALLDFADGALARRFNVSSAMGAELDTLADFLNFGVAPAFVFQVSLFPEVGLTSYAVCLIYILATAWRLARFNIQARSQCQNASRTKSFVGLPSTAAGVSLVLVDFAARPVSYAAISYIIPSAMVCLSVLMVSRIPIPSLPDLIVSLRKRFSM